MEESEVMQGLSAETPKYLVCAVCFRNFDCSRSKPISSTSSKIIFKTCSKFFKPGLLDEENAVFHRGPFCGDCFQHGEQLLTLHGRLKEIKVELEKCAKYFAAEVMKNRQAENVPRTEMDSYHSDSNQNERVVVKEEDGWEDNYLCYDDFSNNNSKSDYEYDSDELVDNTGYLSLKYSKGSEETSRYSVDENPDETSVDTGRMDNTSEEFENLVQQKSNFKSNNKLPWKCEVCAKICVTGRQRKDHKRTVHYKKYQKLLEEDLANEDKSKRKKLVDKGTLREPRAAAIKAKSRLEDLSKNFFSLPTENIKTESNENDSASDELWDKNDDADQERNVETEPEDDLNDKESGKIPKCRVCSRTFANAASLNSHIQTHTSYDCEKCHKTFYSKRSKASHEKVAHRKNSTSLVCEIENCNKSFYNEYDYEVHCLSHTDEIPFECKVCSSKFSNVKNYLNHQRDSPCTTSGIPGAPDDFNCDVCKAPFKARYLLLIHRKQHNTKYKNYKCELCVKNFARKPDFIKHVMVHTDEAPFSCDICGKRFKSSSGVAPHRLSHTGREIFSCKHCDVKCSSTHSLKRHIQSEHQEKVYVCPVCQKPYKIYGDFKVHVRSHSKTIPCEECGKTFYRHADLNRHRRRHTGNLFKCPTCSRGFLNLSCLKKHTEEAHMGKSYICEVCGRVLSTSLSHAVHIKSHQLKEKGERPFPCINCEKKFYTKRELVEHNRVHTGERLICYICGEQFTRKLLLDYHMKTHTGNYTHKCDICGKGMATKTMLTIHIRKHTGEKPFSCHLCGKNFSRKDHMKEHVRRHEKLVD